MRTVTPGIVVAVLLACGLACLPKPGNAEAAGDSPHDSPQRIVSINLCADELLVTLADPDQIADLSIYATDPTLSYVAEAAKQFRHDAAEAETVIDLKPDLILAGRFTKRATREMLGRLGYRVELLDSVTSIASSIAQIRRIAALVGHPDRGEALVEKIEAARTRAEATAATMKERPTAAVYQRRGYVTGAETLTGELLSLAGFVNVAGDLTGKTGGFVPLEKIVATPPDMIVVSTAVARAQDQGSALLAHPALAALFPPDKRVALPDKLTACGGPSLPEAIDWLSAAAQHAQPVEAQAGQ
jgi:iron complex transport system substrate-binding protein